MPNSIPRRGLRSMQIRATRRVTDSVKSPDLYLKLASLEIERSRRVAELDALAERTLQTTERIRLITKEQEDLRQRIITLTQEDAPSVVLPPQSSTPMGFTY